MGWEGEGEFLLVTTSINQFHVRRRGNRISHFLTTGVRLLVSAPFVTHTLSSTVSEAFSVHLSTQQEVTVNVKSFKILEMLYYHS